MPEFWRLFKGTFTEIVIPTAVYEEVMKGKETGSEDVPVIESSIQEGWVKVHKAPPTTNLPDNLGRGEKEAITLMLKERADWLLMDDVVASRTAKLMGVEVRPVVYLLIYWTRKGVVGERRAVELLDELVNTGYRLSAKDYLAIKEMILS